MKAMEFPKCGSEAWQRAEIERMLENDAYDRSQADKKLTITGDFQSKIAAVVEDTRKHVVLPSDACVIQSLAAQVLLLRDSIREFNGLAPDIAQLLDGWHCDTAWTEWDSSVRERLGALQKRTDSIT